MAINDFEAVQDDAIWLHHHPGSPSATVDFVVAQHLTRASGILYYTLVNNVVYRFDAKVNGQTIIANADVGPAGEHKVRLETPPNALHGGDNELEITVHSGGVVRVTDIEAWLQLGAAQLPEQVSISQTGVTLELAPSSTSKTQRLPGLPDRMDPGASGAVEFTIRQGQPRLVYSMTLNGHPTESGPLPVPAGSYELLEIVKQAQFQPGDNRLVIELGYGGAQILFGEVVAWWQRALQSV